MQVFEIFEYNLKDIKFKNTKDYFDILLETLNLNYTDIMFCFNGDLSGNVCKKITKAFPQLSEYVQYLEESARFFKSAPEYCFSSIKNRNGKIERYIKAEHTDDLSAVLKKIPNPINFGFMGVVLDNINWYKDEFQKSDFCSNTQKINYYNHRFNAYFSNSIRFFKEYDFGNKFNLVEVVIERRITKDELEPYPNVFNEFLSKLGNPMNSRIECIFNDDENEEWLNSSKKFRKFIEENSEKICAFSSDELPKINEEYLINSVTPISGFSPKTVFNKIAKVKGYKYSFYENGCYRYQHTNSYNHIFTVELFNIPFSSFFDASVSVEGYNFKHTVCNIRQLTIKNSIEAEEYAKKVFEVAVEAEKTYAERLLYLYGTTPKWYVN